jgi:Uma2 family endonuclease
MVLMTAAFGQLDIPDTVVDLDSFREWVHSGELPEKLKVHSIRGQVWMDLMEELFSHNQVKLAVTLTLGLICREEKLGRFFPDGAFLWNEDANIATVPDGMFVSAASLESGAVHFTSGRTTNSQATQIVGSPDLIVEIVSPSSVEKDLELLVTAYHDAGVREYWIIDVRDEANPAFTIYRRSPKAFVAVRKSKGWTKSELFARSFRLVSREQFGLQDYALESK